MTRPWLAALLLACCLPLQAAPQTGARDASRAAFLNHQPGQPTISDETFRLAREVQEGCELPCSSPDEAAAYLKKVEAAAAQLGLSAADTAKAKELYAPQGVPRKKATSPGPSFLKGRRSPLPEGTAARVEVKLRGIAASLGLTRLLAADLAPVERAARMGAARLDAPPLSGSRSPPPKGASTPGVPVLTTAPLQPAQVDGRLREVFNAEVRKYPTGRKLLDSMRNPPPVVLEKLDSYDTIAQHSRKAGKEKIALNTLVLADSVRSLDPGAAKAGDLTDPAALRRYLAGHPDLMPGLARVFDTWYVHEMTHAAQYRSGGTGAFNDWKNGWVDILNRMKYPIEKEWDAFGTQNRYFHEKAQADPSVLRMNGPFPGTVVEYTDYIDNLAKYRRDKVSLYQGEVDTIDKLRLHGQKEKDYYAAALAQEQREWPKRSAEGFILMARNWDAQNVPTMGLPGLKTAYDRALAGKFLDELRPDLTAVLKEALSSVEARLAKAEANHKPWIIGEPSSSLIKSLSAELKVPLPPRVARALGPK
ncbi:MAG: hypothetical protein NTY77_02845 [Elusimicrobia bacterium]|nr:hypothetical protein [Elusimicrobiota bacterium]